MKKYSYCLLPLIVATTLLSIEPSAFGAGNINSDTPYGLTDNEKKLLDVKKQVEDNDVNVKLLKNQVNTLNEQIDGMRSVFDGLSSRVQNIDQSLNILDGNSNSTSGNLILEIQELKKYVEDSRKIESTNNANIKKTLQDLVDNIDKNYVSKASFNALEARVLALEGKKAVATNNNKPTTNSNNPQSTNMNNIDILNKGEELFAAKNYAEAKPYFEDLLSKNYRPARSNFVLGEIEYFETNYSKAIGYYKISAELYPESNWMPKLMYHTAISFDKINDKPNADQFYKALKATYPNSEEAKASPDR